MLFLRVLQVLFQPGLLQALASHALARGKEAFELPLQEQLRWQRSTAEWVSENPIPTVVAYGTCDKVQPFLASLRLKEALEDNGVDYKYYELPHSGHGLQNDDRISEQWMESIDEYLNKYMPVN